jgi:phosphate-selective porin
MKKLLFIAALLVSANIAFAFDVKTDAKQAYPTFKINGWLKITYQDTVYHDILVTYPSGFEIKDAALQINGNAWQDVSYMIYIQSNRKNKVNDKSETPVTTGETVFSPRMVGAYVDWKVKGWANLRIGQFKKPIGLEQWTSPVNYDFINTAQLTGKFVDNSYDQGIMLFGKKNDISYWLAFYNGSPYDYKDKNWAKDVVARAVYAPLAGLTFGGYTEYGTADGIGPSKYRRRGGLEINYEHCKYFVRSEYMIGLDDKRLTVDSVLVGTVWVKKSGLDAILMRGAYLTAGYVPMSKLKVNVRGDMYRENCSWDLVTDGITAWWGKQESRVVICNLGADYFLNPNTKVTLNYDVKLEDMALRPVKNNILSAQLQVKF